ncbi:4-pyridoxate dehydrogenase, partial [Dermacentor silvarum]
AGVYITAFHPVGGGSAGCVIANRLSEDPDVTVLLLEAGGLETASRQVPFAAPMNLRGDDDWEDWSVTQKNAALSFHEQVGARRLPVSRGKALGGSSVLNFMLYTRGNPRDYDRWAREYGAKGWAYEDVLPHVREIEYYRVGAPDEYHGTSGEVPVDYANTTTRLTELLEACRQSGYPQVDYNGHSQPGCSQLQTNIANGERISASKAFIQPIVGTRENLHVALLSHVTKVNFEGTRAVGASFTRFGRPGTVSAKREVILSAGTVGSTQHLLLSGLGPKEELKQGSHHVDFPGPRNAEDNNDAMRPAARALYIYPRVSFSRTALYLQVFDSYIGPVNGQPGFQAVTILNRPRSRGSITLRSTDPYEHPNIDPRILEHPDDARAAAQGIECLFRHTALPIWHLCCTVAMGSHSEAVLDERLRVRGNVTGLRVADASVMPDIVSGHTNAPSMMIGSKTADMIIEDNEERHSKKRRRTTGRH